MSLEEIKKLNLELNPELKSDPSKRRTLTLEGDLNEELQLGTVEEFVKRFGGSKIIKRLLIASNGIAAVKCMRSIQRWCREMFNNDKAISCIAMVTPEDLAANAEFIKLSAHHVSVPGGDIANNYENPELILEIALHTEVDAVWLGWGLNGRNLNLPSMLMEKNIAFLGPSQNSLSIVGDKISSLILAQSMDIPTLPWSGIGLKANASKKFKIPTEMYLQACVNSAEEGMEIALQIKFPVLILASKSCGSKGFRQVLSPNDFISNFRQMQAEIPDNPLFVMKTIPQARHMETQILADNYGNVISLFNRDCSIFRHHRKIIIEAPSTAALPKCSEDMDNAAVNFAKMAGFTGLGSVEYIYDSNDGQFFFFEFIPQIQIEHPVTEKITKVNLISCHIQMAMGLSLNRIKDIRVLYKEKPWEDIKIDFEKPIKKPQPHGHVIATRITAENPDDYIKLSSSGTVEELTFRSTKNARGYFSFSALNDLLDSQFGHCFAWGDSRQTARANLILALNELQTRGDFKTSIDNLIAVAERNKFIQNNFDAGFLNRIIAKQEKDFETLNIMLGLICTSILIADREISDAFTHFQMALEDEKFLPLSSLSNMADVELIYDGIKFSIEAVKSGTSSYTLIMNQSLKEVDINRLNDGGIMIEYEDQNYSTYLKEDDKIYYVTINGSLIRFEKSVDTSKLKSPANGKLVNFLVEEGAILEKDQPYAELECDNEILVLTSPEKGKVSFQKIINQNVIAHAIIGTLELETPLIMQPKDNIETWSSEEKPYVQEDHIKMFKMYKEILEDQLNGFCLPDPFYENHLYKIFRKFIAYLKTPILPLYELREALNNISKRIPHQMEEDIRKILKSYEDSIDSVVSTFPSEKLAFLIDDAASRITIKTERDDFYVSTQEILKIIQRYRYGFRGYEKVILNELLTKYYAVESHFKHEFYNKCLAKIRESFKSDLKTAMNLIFSHSQVKKKNLLVLLLIDELAKVDGLTEDLEETLHNLVTLDDEDHVKISHKARKFLLAACRPSNEMRKNQMESILLPAAEKYGSSYSAENVKSLISSETLIFDILHEFFYHQLQSICKIALEVYIRRVYIPYEITWLQHWSHTVKDSTAPIPAIHFKFIVPETHPNYIESEIKSSFKRKGCMAAVESFDVLYDIINTMIETFEPVPATKSEVSYKFQNPSKIDLKKKEKVIKVISINEPVFCINIAIRDCGGLSDSQLSSAFEEIMINYRNDFLNRKIRRISFMPLKQGSFPKIFTYRARDSFNEDTMIRNLEPANAFRYELYRLKNYDIHSLPTQNPKIHMYFGKGLTPDERIDDNRIFIRSKVIHSDLISRDASFEYLTREGEHSLLEVLDEIDTTLSRPEFSKCHGNHIFLNFIPHVKMTPKNIQDSMTDLIKKYEDRLWKMHVLQVEIRFVTHESENALRIYFSNESGYFLTVDVYIEVIEKGVLIFKSIGEIQGPWHGLPVSTPYKTQNILQHKRASAHENKTTYCYDFPDMFHQMTEKLWKEYFNERKLEDFQIPKNILIECVELIVNSEGNLEEVQRSPGENDHIGMIAWRLKLATPEFPEGRKIILIANDLNHLDGSMGKDEALLFIKASESSRHLKIPRVFISCSSGARVDLDSKLKSLIKVAWHDQKNPSMGFDYIYLSAEDYSKVSSQNIVQATLIQHKGEPRYKITDIIGQKDGNGIESLRYASMVESETQQAYEEIVTISMVTCKTVGAGVNFVLQGNRVVQIENAYLTTKKLKEDMNLEVGGSNVMQQNGIAHKVEATDLDGIYRILKWLSYIPKYHGSHHPTIASNDSFDREVTFIPSSSYDPRHMLTGQFNGNFWESGFFDSNSFDEIMQEWGRTIVTGRARLGGLPVGVIAADNRIQKIKILNDEILRDGKVLYADSVSKIVQAISDFSREELPLFIFANWTEYSQNIKDIQDRVMKLGNEIVKVLQKYSKPVFIYIPPNAELRGAAWMTFDSITNLDFIETYADPKSRVSVTDPEKMIDENFSEKEMEELILRLHPVLKSKGSNEKLNDSNITTHVEPLLPHYRQVAVNFATLHNTPKRAHEKGCITDIIPWTTSRVFFYWRLKRSLLEQEFVEKICHRYKDISVGKAKLMLRRWFMEHKGEGSSHHYDSDEKIIKWLEDQKHRNSVVNRNLNDVRKQSIVAEVTSLLEEQPESVLDAVVGLCRNLSPENLNEVGRLLTQLTIETKERRVMREKSYSTYSENSTASEKN